MTTAVQAPFFSSLAVGPGQGAIGQLRSFFWRLKGKGEFHRVRNTSMCTPQQGRRWMPRPQRRPPSRMARRSSTGTPTAQVGARRTPPGGPAGPERGLVAQVVQDPAVPLPGRSPGRGRGESRGWPARVGEPGPLSVSARARAACAVPHPGPSPRPRSGPTARRDAPRARAAGAGHRRTAPASSSTGADGRALVRAASSRRPAPASVLSASRTGVLDTPSSPARSVSTRALPRLQLPGQDRMLDRVQHHHGPGGHGPGDTGQEPGSARLACR